MFNIKRVHDNRLDIDMSGKLDSEGMIKVLDELIEKSEGIDDGTMLCDVIDYQLPTLSAIAVELRRLPLMLGVIKKFDKAAVLSDKEWIQKISELEGALVPGLEIKAFDRDERLEAEEWLSS